MKGTRDSYRREVRAWGLVSLFSDLAHESVTALLPILFASMGAPTSALGITEGVSDAVASFTKLGGGRLADRLRRLKLATLAGYALTGFAVPAIALVSNWMSVVVLRAIAWLGRGWRSPLRDTLIVRVVPPERRGYAFGLERAMDQIGAVLGPLVVVALASLAFSERTVIALSIVPGTLAVLCVLVLVREHPVWPVKSSDPSAVKKRDPLEVTS